MDRGQRERSVSRSCRGGVEVLGFVLIVVISVSIIGLVGVFGLSMLDETTQTIDVTHAELALGELDGEISTVAFGQAEHRAIDLGLQLGASDATLETHSDAGWVRVTRIDATDDTVTSVANTTLGAVVYERGGTTLAYQNGGIWRTTQRSTGSTMVTPPEFSYRDGTLMLPIVALDGEASLPSQVDIEQNGSAIRKAPDESANLRNPIRSGGIAITVQSEYYRAWGRYLEQTIGTHVRYDRTNETVTTRLFAGPRNPSVVSGIVADRGFGIENNIDGDSYNSSAGNYSTTKSENLSITTTSDVTLSNNIELDGDLEAAGNVTFEDPNAHVNGNVSYGGSIAPDESNDVSDHVSGWNASNASVDPLSAVDGLVEWKRHSFAERNDNERAAAIDAASNRLTSCTPQCELSAGRYYLDGIDLGSNEELVLNTTGGDIEIVVDGDLSVQSGTIRLNSGNDNEARFYVTEDLTLEESKTNVTVPGQRAPRQWFFTKSAAEATIANKARFVGVLYGPGGDGTGTDISISNQPSIYGALVGGLDPIPNNAHIHYDEALRSVRPGGSSSSSRLKYLRASIHRANVSG